MNSAVLVQLIDLLYAISFMFKPFTVQKLRPHLRVSVLFGSKGISSFSLQRGLSAFHLFLSPLVFQIPNLNSAIPFLSFIVL